MNSSHAVAILITTPDGIPLVRDPKKPEPRYWKLPGGRSEGEETPRECAVREIYEELGLQLNPTDLKVIERQDKSNYTLTFFKIELPQFIGLKEIGNEQEEIKVFHSLKEISELEDSFPNHKKIINQIV
ncbi:MAG: hypothetical protein JWN37_672 [Candidatus Nomurabacteria bacterium]|nr:hypothetical protein [Candidatus Nomurabacteria bacterium]